MNMNIKDAVEIKWKTFGFFLLMLVTVVEYLYFFFWKWARICHYWFYFCKNVVFNVVGNQTCIDFLKLNTTAFFVLFFSIYLPQTVLLCFEMFKSTYQWWKHQMLLLTFHTRKGWVKDSLCWTLSHCIHLGGDTIYTCTLNAFPDLFSKLRMWSQNLKSF